MERGLTRGQVEELPLPPTRTLRSHGASAAELRGRSGAHLPRAHALARRAGVDAGDVERIEHGDRTMEVFRLAPYALLGR